MRFRDHILQLVHRNPTEETPPEVAAELGQSLLHRRASTDAWFFLLRVLIGVCALIFLAFEAALGGGSRLLGFLWVGGYVAGNGVVHLLGNRGFGYMRWGYAGLDFFGIVLLRHYYPFEALLDANATMIGLYSLMLVAYVHYSDIRLTSAMAVGVLVVTVLTLWHDALSPFFQESPLSAGVASYYAQPLPALLLLGYIAAVSLITHHLVHRLYAQLLRYSVEQHKRAKAAVASAVERSHRERLEELNQLKHYFITVISHELRHPITPLLSSLDVLESERSGDCGPDALLGIARESAGHIQRVITDYAKLVELITLDDEHLMRWNIRVNDLLALLREQTVRQPRLLGRFDDLVVCTDPRLLGGALMALMRRAAMLTGGDDLVTLCGYPENGSVVMSIHDPGSYLEAQAIASLDDPFTLTGAPVFAAQNTGLELLLARHSLRRIGGALEVDSQPDNGTTVYCMLPGMREGARWLSDDQLRRELSMLGT